MVQIAINWWPIIVATLLRMVVGSIWFSPIAFVKPWQALAGVTPEQMQQGLAKAIVIDLIMSLILSFVLYHSVMYATGSAPSLLTGAGVGLLSWLGFILATHLPLWAYENRPLKLIAIGAGSNLVSLVLMGALFGVWH
jgi:hypothetical protein